MIFWIPDGTDLSFLLIAGWVFLVKSTTSSSVDVSYYLIWLLISSFYKLLLYILISCSFVTHVVYINIYFTLIHRWNVNCILIVGWWLFFSLGLHISSILAYSLFSVIIFNINCCFQRYLSFYDMKPRIIFLILLIFNWCVFVKEGGNYFKIIPLIFIFIEISTIKRWINR